jgi:hypothetical protein
VTSEVALRQPAISPTPRQSELHAAAPHRFSVLRQLLTVKPEKSPAIIARAGLEPVRDRWTRPRFPGRRSSPFRRLFGGGLRADLLRFWRPCPRVDGGVCPSVLSGCELMTSGDSDVSLSTRGLSNVFASPETPKSGALWPDISGVYAMIDNGSPLAEVERGS